jgi:hypothetical protein
LALKVRNNGNGLKNPPGLKAGKVGAIFRRSLKIKYEKPA